MQTDTVLTEIADTARALAEQKTLRSKAVLIERLKPLIDRAVALGHKHEAIHDAIQKAGVEMTFGVYRNTLHRVRVRAGAASVPVFSMIGSGEPKPVAVSGSGEPNLSGSQEPKAESSLPEPASDGGVFGVRDALTQAQQTSQTDYRKHARSKRNT